eukprot:g2362.t1
MNHDPIKYAEDVADRVDNTEDRVFCGGLGLSTNSFFVFGKDCVKKVLSHSVSVKHSTRNIGQMFPIWDKLFGTALFMTSGQQWKRIHKICLRAMGSVNRDVFWPFVDMEARNVLREFNDLVDSDESTNNQKATSVLGEALKDARKRQREKNGEVLPFLINKLFAALSLRVICSVSFGQQADHLYIQRHLKTVFTGDDEGKGSPVWAILDMLPGFLDLPIPWNNRRLGSVKELHNYCRTFIQMNEQEIEEGKKSSAKNLLKLLLEASHPDEGKLTEQEVLDNVFGFMMAGLTTTQDTMVHIAVQLALHESCQEKLRKEIIRVTGGADPYLPFDMNDIAKMTYLSCVVKEVMRLYPSVIGVPPRILTEDVEVGGVVLASGSQVNTNSLFGHRMKMNYGEDAKNFRPERFEEYFANGNGKDYGDGAMTYAFTTFGAGRRQRAVKTQRLQWLLDGSDALRTLIAACMAGWGVGKLTSVLCNCEVMFCKYNCAAFILYMVARHKAGSYSALPFLLLDAAMLLGYCYFGYCPVACGCCDDCPKDKKKKK